MWVNQNFLLPSEINAESNALDVRLLSLRTETPLLIKMKSSGEVSRNIFAALHLLQCDLP